MKLLVTGAAGMLGADVRRAAATAGHEVVALSRLELDVRDAETVLRRVAGERPDAVVNCAAFTNVDGAESDARGAALVNATGAGNVARAAAEAGAKVLYVSSDYVFDGEKDAPRVESDPTGPLSVYGETKLAGEHETRGATDRHFVVRSSWLFGTGGGNFVATMLGLARDRGEVTVVDDQVGCPTWTGHLAPALVSLLATDAFGTHHVAGAGHCSWFGFAREIFRQAEIPCRVTPCLTAEMPRPARRPRWSVLGTERPDAPRLPDWREGLASYLSERSVAA